MTKTVLYNYVKQTTHPRIGPNSLDALLLWTDELATIRRGVMRSGWKDRFFEVEAWRDPHGLTRPIFTSFTLYEPQGQPGRTVYPTDEFVGRIFLKYRGRHSILAEIPGKGAKQWDLFFTELEKVLFYYKLKVQMP